MKNFFTKCMVVCLTGVLTLLGFGSCKTTKISKKQRQRQEQAYRDSVEAAEMARQEAEAQRRLDSLRVVQKRIDVQKTVYAGPTMVDRRKIKKESQ